jgi:hypothetical protein
MMKRAQIVLVFLIAVVFFSGAAQANLSTIGTATYGGQNYNLVYDSGQHLVWLDYTREYDTWSHQVSWATGLSGVLTYHLNSGINVTWSGVWQLPTTPGTTWGLANEGEMGHLNDELGNTSPFTNLRASAAYWSGTEYEPGNKAWFFIFGDGLQEYDAESMGCYALAVHEGNVAPVPLPASLFVLGPGLVGLAAIRRRFKK